MQRNILNIIVALLFIIVPAARGAAQTLAATLDEEPEKITPEEERGASEMAELFLKGLEEKQDFAPLLDELFVDDFAERFHAVAGSGDTLYFLDPSVAAQASRDDVRRYYVAFNNMVLLASLSMLSAEAAARANSSDEDEPEETKLADIFPPEVLDLFRNDPLLGPYVLEVEAEERTGQTEKGATDEGEKTDKDEEELIKSVEQLRALTSTIERAVTLFKQHLSKDQVGRSFAEWRTADKDEESTLMRPSLNVLTKQWYGYPEGTRIFCVNVLVFHVDIVKDKDRFKILAAYLTDD